VDDCGICSNTHEWCRCDQSQTSVVNLALFELPSSAAGPFMQAGNENIELPPARRFRIHGPKQMLHTLNEGSYLGGSVTGLAIHSAGTSVSVCPIGCEDRAVWLSNHLWDRMVQCTLSYSYRSSMWLQPRSARYQSELDRVN
jgi:hypothetical protein